MAKDSIRVSDVIPASAGAIYAAWLDPEAHGAMTEGAATAEPGVGGKFTAHSGYISGVNLELEDGKRILQTWRTAEFPADAGDSRLEVLLEPAENGTEVTLIHTEIPEGQGARYEDGWTQFYFNPMRKYFGAKEGEKPAASKKASKKASKPAAKKGASKKAAKPAAKKAAKKAAKPTAKKATKKAAKPAAKKAAKPAVKKAAKPAEKPAAKPAAKKAAKKAAKRRATKR